MIKDVRGKESSIGDLVAFAGGMKGASKFFTGKIVKITAKQVTIEYEADWCNRDGVYPMLSVRRNEGMFAILEKSQ